MIDNHGQISDNPLPQECPFNAPAFAVVPLRTCSPSGPKAEVARRTRNPAACREADPESGGVSRGGPGIRRHVVKRTPESG
eukprot:g19817.t1